MKKAFQQRDVNTPDLHEELTLLKAKYSQLEAENTHLRTQTPALDEELKDVKSKLRVITSKFANVRKERDKLKGENQGLQEEILQLQVNMRQMVPGLQNTSASFPVLTELTAATEQFYKCDCQDFFFETLSPELTVEGVIYFFRTVFGSAQEQVAAYFEPMEKELRRTCALDSLEGPIMNVLRKSCQATWKKLHPRSLQAAPVVKQVQQTLKLNEPEASLSRFIEKLGEIYFCYYVSDPPVSSEVSRIGDRVEFNPMKHEAMDGFLRAGDPCYVLLPYCVRNGDVFFKAAVLHVDYEFPA
jgi:hypothetical protein